MSKVTYFALAGIVLAVCSIALFVRSPEEPERREAFPLILYGVPNVEQDIARAKELGFNYIYRSGSGFAGDPNDLERMQDIQSYLDAAVSHGMKVVFCLDGPRRIARGEVGMEQMQGIVRRFKDHPAVGFWYLYDEPNLPSPKTRQAMLAARFQEESAEADGGKEAIIKEVRRPAEELKPFYDMVKREAPDIPVILMMAITNDGWWVDAWKKFHSTYDVISFNTYPVYAAPFPDSNLKRVTDWMERYTRGTDKPVMPCLQTFNWNSLKSRVERAKKAGRTDYTDWRYPNLQELRYWNFSSLIQGAPGVIYYTYGGPDSERRPPEEWFNGVLKPTTREFQKFLVKTQQSNLKTFVEKGAVRSASWKTKEGRFVVIANCGPAEQHFDGEEVLSELNRGKPTAWEFTRVAGLDLKAGSVTGVNLAPWEVQVWNIK